MSDIRFDGRVAVITGAGGGLGRTYALEIARRGGKVVVNDLGGKADGTGASHSMADTVVKEITEAGGEAIANYDSVSTPEGGEAMIKAAVERFGKVDIVINNAGILRDKTFAKLAPEELEHRARRAPEGRVLRDAARLPRDEGERLRPHPLHRVGRRHLRQLRPDQLRRRQDGPRRPLERARRRGREEQHQVQRDRADRADAAHRAAPRAHGRQALARTA